MMLIEKLKNPAVLARLLLPFLLITFSGLSPRPLLADRQLQLAWQAIQAGNDRAVAQYLSQAAELLPQYPSLWEQAGQYAVRSGDPQKAMQYLQQAEQRGVLSQSGKIAFGDAYQAAGELTIAIQIWQSMPPSIETLTRLYIAHQKQKDIPAQIDDLKALVLLQPNKAELYYRLGLLLAATQPGSALAYLLQASERDPQYSQAYQALTDTVDETRQADEPAYVSLSVGRTLASLQEWDLAEYAFEQATQYRPDYAEAWAFLGEARQHLANAEIDTQSGLAELTKAWELDPNSIAANTFLAFYWQRQRRYDLALVYIQSAANLEPANPVLQLEMGNVQVKLGNLPVAQACYQLAIQLAPYDPVYWRVLAEYSLSNQVQIRQIALPAARQAVILDPKDPLNLDLLGQAYQLLEDYALAERFFLLALQAEPQFAPAHLHLGMNYLFQGNLLEARQELILTSSLVPESVYAAQAQRLLNRYFP